MIRRVVLFQLIAIVGLGLLPATIDLVSVDAAAQSTRPNFFQRLFGIQPKSPPVVVHKSPKRRARRRRSAPRSKPPVETVKIQPKEPDARKILVVGDFVAGSLARGLEQAYAEEPKIAVIDKSKANSGLARPDSYNWNAALLDTLNEVQPDLIVVAFGANDRQQLRLDGARQAFRSDVWVTTYTQRITGIVETLRVFGRPFFWMGAPPMHAAAASADMAYLNDLYKPRVESGGGDFVDIWNGFSDKDGRYVASGPDVDGQVRQLRTRDGINFTGAGRLKLAFYVRQEIRWRTGFDRGHIDLLATATHGDQIEIEPDGTKLLVGPIISLENPLPGFNTELAGETAASPPDENSPQYKMIVRGETLPKVRGRVDDFTWPRRKHTGLLPEPASADSEPVAETTVPIPVARPEGVAKLTASSETHRSLR